MCYVTLLAHSDGREGETDARDGAEGAEVIAEGGHINTGPRTGSDLEQRKNNWYCFKRLADNFVGASIDCKSKYGKYLAKQRVRPPSPHCLHVKRFVQY